MEDVPKHPLLRGSWGRKQRSQQATFRGGSARQRRPNLIAPCVGSPRVAFVWKKSNPLQGTEKVSGNALGRRASRT